MIFDQLTRCRAWIEAALEYSGGTHTFDDIAAGVLTGRFRLWERHNGCAVTEFVMFPRKKVLNVFLAGGDMQAIKDLEQPAVEFARANGCHAMTISGRSGWKRALPHWRQVHQTQELTL